MLALYKGRCEHHKQSIYLCSRCSQGVPQHPGAHGLVHAQAAMTQVPLMLIRRQTL